MKQGKDILTKDISEWLENDSNDHLKATEFALSEFARSQAIQPPSRIKSKILNQISELNDKRKSQGKIDLSNPPMISKDSNLYDWLEASQNMQIPKNFEDIHLEPILRNEKCEMFIAWVAKMVPEEVHDDILESFLLLEGSCTCHISDSKGQLRIVNMQAGDFITMNLGETHDLVITSEKPAKAVLQWLKVAA